jgi:hypothetical protein
MISLICPISPYRINETVARLVALTMVTLIALYALTGLVWIALFIALDYFIRGFTHLPYSPASWFALQVTDQFFLSGKLIDKAPKIFAARVGFLLAFSGVLLFFISPTASIVAVLILMFFATLESVFNYCVGCVMYTLLVFPILGKPSNQPS